MCAAAPWALMAETWAIKATAQSNQLCVIPLWRWLCQACVPRCWLAERDPQPPPPTSPRVQTTSLGTYGHTWTETCRHTWGFSYTNIFQRQSCYASRNNLIGFFKPQWGFGSPPSPLFSGQVAAGCWASQHGRQGSRELILWMLMLLLGKIMRLRQAMMPRLYINRSFLLYGSSQEVCLGCGN